MPVRKIARVGKFEILPEVNELEDEKLTKEWDGDDDDA